MSVQPRLLDPSNPREIERYLVDRRLVAAENLPVAIERAGAGNMNLALQQGQSGLTRLLQQASP